MSFDIPFIKPRFPAPEAIAADFAEIVASNWYSNFGPKEREFSARIEQYVAQDTHAVSIANATIGLMAALTSVLGTGDGRRSVIVPSFTFAAGPEAIEWSGFAPLFIDIEPESLQPSLDGARQAVDEADVAGVLLCNSFGIGNSRIREWEDWARSAGLPLIIDSAAGFGSRYSDGQRLGAAGAAEVFSFHATKPFAVGEAGAILTRDAALADRLRSFQNFGFGTDRQTEALGLNGKLSEFSAAIGLRQFDGFDAVVSRRQEILRRYRDRLGVGWTLPTGADSSSVCFATMVAPDARARDAAWQRLTEGGIEVRRYYDPVVHRHPHFRARATVSELPVTDDIASRVLSLPAHETLSDGQIERVSDLLNGGTRS